jgi:putative membrane protein
MNRAFAFNQGFYNLFLAIAIFLGLSMNTQVLVDYGALSVLGAGVVLLCSGPGRARAAMIQIGPATIYFILRVLS